MGHFGSLPPLRFGTWVPAKGRRQHLFPRKPRQTQPLARGSSSDSVSTVAQKRKLVGKASSIGETKRRRMMQPDQRGQEQLGGKSRTCSWLDPKVSEVDHFTSHSQCKGFCIRCDLYRNRKDYDACTMLENKQIKQSWLKTGAHRGVWGMGCRLCAAFAATGAHIGSRCSKFARFQVRPPSRYRAREALLQHATSVSHRRACGLRRGQPLAR